MLVVRLPARFPLRFLIAVALGVLHAFAFLDDAAWPLQIFALAALLAQGHPGDPRGLTPWAEARVGLGFGLGWFLTGTSWVYTSMHLYGGMAAPLAALATVLFCTYLALFPALACGLRAWLDARWRTTPLVSALCVFPALWLLAEWLRGTLFTGYPWIASGYAHVGSPLAGYAPVLGVYGMALLATVCAGALVLLGQRRSGAARSNRIAGVVLAAVLLVGFGLRQFDWSQPAGAPVTVRLLQGNVPQEAKFSEGRFATILNDYLQLIEAQPAQLIVLPETAIPRFLHNVPRDAIDRLLTFTRSTGSAVALGVPVFENGNYFNSVVAITPDGAPAQRYDKSHLVPFGEFIPPGFRWFVDLMHIPLGDFTRGRIDAEPLRLAGTRVAFNICYEDIFGAEIARQAESAHLLVNSSNVAWFGDSLALPQHLQASRLRALETGRPMLRATNTGMTAVINPRGEVVASLAPHTRGALAATVQGTTGRTPYMVWRDAGPLLVGGLLLALALFLRGRRKAAAGRHEISGPQSR